MNLSILYFTVSNDTYHYLLSGEEPLDEDNLEEAKSLDWDLSVCGSKIVNYDISLVKVLSNGKVEIAVTPVFTHRIDMGKYVVLEFRYSYDKSHILYRWHNLESSLCWGLGSAIIEYNSANKPQFRTNKGSVIPLQSPNIIMIL